VAGVRVNVRRWSVRLAIAFGVIIALWLGLCYQVIQNPSVVTHPSAADAIFVLGGSTDPRTEEAIDLANEGVSHVLVLSNAIPNPKATELCEHPPAGWTLICFRPSPNTTQGEAEFLGRLAAEKGWTKIVAITSRYHISRARLLIKRCVGGRLQMVSDHETIGAGQWLYQYAYQSVGYLKAALHPGC
jgi:uncharacterized SAM-binding protein YcdF (DUF218 family)